MNVILKNFRRPLTLSLAFVASIMLVCVLALPAESAMAWKVKIKIEARGDTGKIILGAATDATDGFENTYEARAILSGYLMTYVRHPEWGQETQFFWTDVRDTTLPKEWSWYVQSRYRNREHTMTWTIDAPEGLELYLMDTVTGEVIDMRAESSYSYNNTSTAAREFVVEAAGSIGEQVPQDTTPPETVITSAPSGYLADTSYSFAFTGTDDVSGVSSLEYSYSFDGSEWSDFDMDTSKTITSAAEGEHSFLVKAKDLAGNIDPTPAEASFVVDLTPPEIVFYEISPPILWPPNGKTKNVTITGSITDALSGVSLLTYTVIDEYGEINTTGAVPTTGGPFTITVELMAKRFGNDLDGRLYTISFTGIDNVGNAVTGSVDVVVPHDRAVREK